MMWLAALALGAEPARFALVAGANDGGPRRGRLRYAVSDALAMGEVLTELGGVAADRLVVLGEPTPAELRRSLAEVGARARAAGEGSSLVVYYSGHSDREGLQLGGEVYPWDQLRSDLQAVDTGVQVAIVDGCASGSLVRAKGGTAAPAFLTEAGAVEGRAWLTSSSVDELSQEADHLGGSYFTHALLTGLRGAADVDGDGQVTLREAHAFAAEETLARTERTRLGAQHPTYDLRIKGVADFVLTDVSDHRSRLLLPASLRGRLYLRDADQRLVAELPLRGEAVELALAAGRYQAVLDDQGALAEGTIKLGDGAGATLSPDDLVPVKGEVTLARGRLYATVPVAITLLPYPTSEGLDARDQLHWTALGVIAVHGARLRGVSLGTVASAYRDGADGVQLAGAYAHAGGPVRGVQLALGANASLGELRGVQVAPLNLAHTVRGVQLGVVNATHELRGLAIGVVQLASTSPGVPVALLPLVGDGIHEVGVWVSTDRPLNLGAQLGSRSVYTAYTAAWSPAGRHGSVGLGLGHRARVGTAHIDVDGVVALAGTSRFAHVEPTLRATVARPLHGEHLAPFVRASVALVHPLGSHAPLLDRLLAVALGERWGLVPSVGAGMRW